MAKRGGFPGGMNMQSIMAQAQKMQQQMQKSQEELEAREFEATAGGGVVKATVTDKLLLTNIEIAPEAVDPDDVEMLQDLVLAAVNEALTKAHEAANREMGKYTGGMNLGGLF